MTPELSIVIPVYNEGENIAKTLAGISENVGFLEAEIVIVYDFDEDSTVPVVEKLKPSIPGIRLHKNDTGRGVLNAIRSGFAAARAPFVLVMMADGSDNPASIVPMVSLANQGADVVAGSRYMPGGKQVGGPPLKKLLSRAAGISLYLLRALPIRDATNNFRLYSRRVLDEIPIQSEGGFELALELTVKAHLAGMKVTETPTTWQDRSAGESRFKLMKWLPSYLRWYRLALFSRRSPDR